jgi:sugar fermentation stimulation protein A
LFPKGALVQREKTYGNSRFDLYVEYEERKAFIEVKGVTQEKEGVVLFPDAPTQRGLKHVEELIGCIREGYEAYLLLVIQMKGVKHFEPNRETDPAFSQALQKAADAGVHILAVDSLVTPDSLTLDAPVPVIL